MLDIDRAKVEVPYTTRMWGQDVTCEPKFIETALGDGGVLLGLEPVNTRPNYYVIRVDSSWHFSTCSECKGECPDYIVEHIDDVYEAIDDEYGNAESIRDDNEAYGGSDDDGWPALSEDSGSSWFMIDPKKYLRSLMLNPEVNA